MAPGVPTATGRPSQYCGTSQSRHRSGPMPHVPHRVRQSPLTVSDGLSQCQTVFHSVRRSFTATGEPRRWRALSSWRRAVPDSVCLSRSQRSPGRLGSWSSGRLGSWSRRAAGQLVGYASQLQASSCSRVTSRAASRPGRLGQLLVCMAAGLSPAM